MKSFVILATIALVAVVDVNCQETSERMNQYMETCKQKLDITDEEIKEKKPNPKFRCFSECFLTEMRALVDGEIKLDKVIETTKIWNPELSDEKIEEIHEKCLEKAKQKDDKCDFARKYHLCFIDTLHPRED